MRNSLRLLAATLLTLSIVPSASAQYFGRNKVQWEDFKFKVLQTQHFDIYYYDQEADVVQDIGRQAERWYARLSTVFNHSFTRKPIVLYSNSADFQQTTTTGGLIPEGTGGFTDEFMNRVVLPLTGDYAENDHVLGHELVHVFQYDMAAAQNNNRRRFSLNQLPLWVIEGMAEYFSKGRYDPLTAMWVRDATIHNRMPDLRKLTGDPRYFPYRYGQALLAYIGGRFGDEAVVRYFLAAGLVGLEPAFERVLGLSAKQVFADWHEASREQYNPIIAARPTRLGAPLLSKLTTRADLNIGPAVSPDGRYVAFLSTRELFSVDLFLADAQNGKILRRLVSADRDAHMDALRFIDSAGSWSPDSTKLAYVVFARGDNHLGIVDVGSRRQETISIPGVDAISAVAWSPDGRSIALSGQQTGVSDLFLYDLETKQVRALTSDKYADMQPAWSPDGKRIIFVTDRGSNTDLAKLNISDTTLALLDVATGSVQTLTIFPNAKHISPQFAPDGNTIYFVSNPEGIPDIYRFGLTGGGTERVTAVQTGVSGITDLSPSLSVAWRSGEVVFSLFEDDNYNIYRLPAAAKGTAVASTGGAEMPRAGTLPPLRATGSEISAYLSRPEQGLPPVDAQFKQRAYRPNLHVAYIGPPTIGVGADRYGFGVGGSVSAYYSDILGQHNVGFTFAGAGTGYGSIIDQIGGEVFYLNQKKRFNWGADLTHIPYVSVLSGYSRGPVDIGNGNIVVADIYEQLVQTQTIDDASLLAQYPFSTTRRFEAATGVQRYSYKAELQTLIAIGSNIIDERRERLPGGFSLTMFTTSAAFVGDSSLFGFISPIRGTRYRYELESLTGDLQFQTALADWRKYIFMRPVTLAVRGLHFGRYGRDADNGTLSPLDLGQSWLVRGYDSIDLNECVGSTGCPVYERLIGSKIATTSLELRVPLFGTKEYGLFNVPAVPVELVGFADAGLAWSKGQSPSLKFVTDTAETAVPVTSVGIGARILLAYIPIEIYAAKPFQRPDKNIVYGFNIVPGW